MMQQRRYVIPHYKVRHIKNVCWLNGSTYAGQRVFEVKADNADNSHIRKCVESRDSTRYHRNGASMLHPLRPDSSTNPRVNLNHLPLGGLQDLFNLH